VERVAEALKNLAETCCFQNRSKKRAEDFTRKRKMGFKQLIYFMLSMIKESSQTALERYFEKTDKSVSMSQQAFSLARQKIKWEAFREMFDLTVTTYYSNDEIERWNGMRIHAVDGSKLALPNDPPLREHFGTSGTGSTSPTAQGSVLYDILNDVVIDARIEPIAGGEQALALKHIHHLAGLRSFVEWRELVIFDRGYPSFSLIQTLLSLKIHYLIRVRAKFSTAIDALDRGDHVIELEQSGVRLPVRVIKFWLSSGEIETLITDVMDKKYGRRTFKSLYFKRWPVETKYDEVKKKLEIENFSGRLVDNIRQDFFATMTLANVAADLFQEAQAELDSEQEEKENKYWYQINVNHEIGVLKDRLIQTLLEDDDKKRGKMFDEIVSRLKVKPVPLRPGRSIPRTAPRKVKFHHNHKSNC
jgi:hypothetical protein